MQAGSRTIGLTTYFPIHYTFEVTVQYPHLQNQPSPPQGPPGDVGIEVQTAPHPGCLMVVGGLFSFGLVPLILILSLKTQPTRMGPAGMTLKNGTQIPWSSLTKVVHVRVHGQTGVVAERFDLSHPKGVTKVVLNRIYNRDAVFNYILRYVPPHLLKSDDASS